MWRRFALLRLNLPLASFLKRFAAPLLVLSFGMVLPFSDIAPGAPCGRLWGPDNYLSFAVFERTFRAARYGDAAFATSSLRRPLSQSQPTVSTVAWPLAGPSRQRPPPLVSVLPALPAP